MINKKHISLLTLAIFLSLSHFAVSASAQPSVVEVPSVSVQPSVDSLSHYLEQAARSNPQVNADFMLYKASLEKIPQAGAFADPELEISFFVKPMETLMGKQIADFTLMQMFPWFGTRKAARSEASEMARMAYEQFRDTRNNLWYEVKAQWYQLSSLNEQYHITEANIRLLYQLEQLALNRFSASSAQAAPSSTSVTSVAWEEWAARRLRGLQVFLPAALPVETCPAWEADQWETLLLVVCPMFSAFKWSVPDWRITLPVYFLPG